MQCKMFLIDVKYSALFKEQNAASNPNYHLVNCQ